MLTSIRHNVIKIGWSSYVNKNKNILYTIKKLLNSNQLKIILNINNFLNL